MATGEVPPPAEGQDDPYLLRDLTWCELCKHNMVPVLLVGVRYYGCTSPNCTRPLVPAEGLEHLIWKQYALLYEGADIVIATARRWQLLRHVLKRVRIGEDMFEFWCEWAGSR